MKILKYFAALSLFALPFHSLAQELKGEMEVEGSYTPEIIRQEKLATYPNQPIITITESSLSYDRNGQPMSYDPFITPMVATDRWASRSISDNRGYLNAALGSYLNSNLSAGYRFIDNSRSTVGAWMQFNSSSLFHPVNPDAISNPYRRRYDGKIGVYATHNFENHGRLSASLDYALGHFNYFSSLPEVADCKSPYQTVNDLNLSLKWNPVTSGNGLKWNIAAGLKYIGFNSLFLPYNLQDNAFPRVKGERETDINLSAAFQFPWESGSRIGLDALFDLLLYQGADRKVIAGKFPGAYLPEPVDDYARLSLTPYYGFQRGLLNVRLGADIDLSFNAGPEGSRYSLFHIAPDVRLDWRKDAVALFLHILGGTELQTLASLRQLDYYTMPDVITTRPVFSPLDATAGLSFGPFAGFSADISAAYKISDNTRLGGWYPFILSGNRITADDNTSALPDIFCPDNRLTLRGWSFALNLNYKYNNLLEISASGSYQHQRNGHGYFNGYDRPRYTLDATFGIKPVTPLSIALEYNLRALRTFYYYSNDFHNISLPPTVTDGIWTLNQHSVAPFDVPNFSNLSLSAEYSLSDSFAIRVRADNILCRRNVISPGMTSEKLSLSGGFSFLF